MMMGDMNAHLGMLGELVNCNGKILLLYCSIMDMVLLTKGAST